MSHTASKKREAAQPSLVPPVIALPQSETAIPVDEELVRQRAYQRWEAAGKPDGDPVAFWLEAERELR